MDDYTFSKADEFLDVHLEWDENLYGEVWRNKKDVKRIFFEDKWSGYLVRCLPKSRALFLPFNLYGLIVTIREIEHG